MGSQLGQALTKCGVQPVHHNEQIACLVPRRNIETWILCLCEQAVDEGTDYKRIRDDGNELIPEASNTLFQWSRTNSHLPGHCIDSIRRGIAELRRLE